MQVYIGAENIISPLGKSAEENFEALKSNRSGIHQCKGSGFNGEDLFISRFNENEPDFNALITECLEGVLKGTNDPKSICADPETLLIISTTKGDLSAVKADSILAPSLTLGNAFGFKNPPLIISNACISGILAIITAGRLIRAGRCKRAVVIGADAFSDFVLYGFQSLMAIADGPCRPFDKNRTGINLGAGAGGVLVSAEPEDFINKPLELLGGASANDANHISGPSRTGEGLFRAVKHALKSAGINKEDIDYISAHGTATLFNDEMESIAFDRLGLNDVPLNSLKGYFGHTLGAAGVIESVIGLQSMRQGVLIKNLGFEEQGTTHNLNVITENRSAGINTILKTGSGFGGCNAAVVFRKVQ